MALLGTEEGELGGQRMKTVYEYKDLAIKGMGVRQGSAHPSP